MADSICRICGKEGPLSFEHIPPQSVGNDHTVKLYSGVDAVKSSLIGQDDMEGMKYRQLQRGQGFKTICSSCNSYLGQNYVKPFSEFYRATGQQVLVSDFQEEDKSIQAFRCLVWVSGSGGGGAGRVVWGYGYHVVVHRRPATA